MNVVSIARPDVTLRLDLDGVIQDVSVSNTLSNEDVSTWVGHRWVDTVSDDAGTKVRRMVEDAVSRNVSAFRQVTQRFPSGLELLIEYTTVRLGDGAGLIAVGKSLQAVSELQSKLLSAQQEMEREYWKIRELESRYRLLFDNSSEAFVLIRAATMEVVEANPSARRELGLPPDRGQGAHGGPDFLEQVAASERDQFVAMLRRVSEIGKAPGILAHLGRNRDPWLVRASLTSSGRGMLYLLQLTPSGSFLSGSPTARDLDSDPLGDFMSGIAAPFLVIDSGGRISFANRALSDLLGADSPDAILGKSVATCLANEADMRALLHEVGHGAVPGPLVATVFRTLAGMTIPTDLVVLRADGPGDDRTGLLLLPAGSAAASRNTLE